MLQELYDSMPIFIQNLMCSVKGWLICKRRYNKHFFEELSRFQNGKYSQSSELISFLESIRTMGVYSQYLEGVDFDELRQNPPKVYDVIQRFPIINKTIVKENLQAFTNNAYDGKVMEMKTSGTTGGGLVFPYSIEMENKQWAIWWRYRISIGAEFGTWCGWFGGRAIINPLNHKYPYWRINRPGRQIMFSLYHLTRETVNDYCNEIINRNLKWLHGYPSSITRLASLILDNNISPITNVEIITTGAENLYDHQIVLMKRAFPNANVRQHYGLAEGVANISQDLEGNWHVDDDFCYVEFIPIDDDTSTCRIIGTNMANRAFPLIRYDTGDIAKIEWVDSKPKLVKIEGRSDDYITLPNGAKINSGLDYILKDSINVRESQLHQLSLSEFEFIIIKNTAYSTKDEDTIRKNFEARFGKEVSLVFKYVDSIDRTRAGKFKMFISHI